MGGYIAAEVAIQFPERVDAAGAGLRRRDLERRDGRRRRSSPSARIAAALAANGATRYRRLAARPVSRHLSLALVARHPRLLKADLAYEGFFKGARQAGLRRRRCAPRSTTTSATGCRT